MLLPSYSKSFRSSNYFHVSFRMVPYLIQNYLYSPETNRLLKYTSSQVVNEQIIFFHQFQKVAKKPSIKLEQSIKQSIKHEQARQNYLRKRGEMTPRKLKDKV